MNRPPYSARCEMLFNADNLQLQKFPGILQPAVEGKTGLFGNWVGGEVHCLTDRLVFTMNAQARPYQRDTADIVIPYAQVSGVRRGRSMLIARTVDVETTIGLLRLRLDGREGDRLLEEIAARIG